MADSLATLTQIASRTFAPLSRALGSDELLIEYFAKLGWSLPEVPQVLTDLRAISDTLVDALGRLERELRLAADGSGSEADLLQAIADLVPALTSLTSAIRALPDGLRTQLPQAFIDATHLAEDLLKRIFADSISRELESEQPGMYQVAQLLGVAETVLHERDPARFQPEYEERTLRWDRLGLLANGPGALMKDVYGWGTPQLNGQKLFLALRDLSFNMFAPGFFDYTSPAVTKALLPSLPDSELSQAGIVIPLLAGTPIELVLGCYALPKRTATELQGVMFTVSGLGEISESFEITPELKLEIDGNIDLAAGVALAVWPDRAPQLIGNAGGGVPAPIVDANATIRLRYAPPDPNQKLSLLSFEGVQLDARGLVMAASLGSTTGEGADLGVQVSLPGLHLRLSGLGQDSFLSSILPSDASLGMDFGIGWSMSKGLQWMNGAGPTIRIPVAKTIGPVKLDAVDVQLTSPDDNWKLAIGVTASARLGPVAAQVIGLGFALKLNAQGGNFGLFDLSGSVSPPQGVGLSIDVKGVVSGGGTLIHYEAESMYAGAMQLSVHDDITVKAFGLIATRLPDGSAGYSLIIFITAEDFRPIQLGLGFTLLGIGGIVGVNRTFDYEVLRQGLKSGTLGTLLFPRDPVGNVTSLIRSLASAFPARRGSYLLGLMAKIGWFTPTLIMMDLALVLEFGSRERLLALGRISANLPSADNDLIRLNMEAIGVIDFDEGSAAVDAVLVDSRLAKKFPVTGSAALRAGGSGADSAFVLSVGGLNPHYTPPTGFPSLERVAIALSSGDNPRLVCEAYFALTANTAQFGARASLYAGAGGFSVQGDIGFDVLINFRPLHFIADYHARLQLKAGSHNLFMVDLTGQLEGPRPLRVSGKATFSILWCDFSVKFDTTLVHGDPPPLPPAVNVLAQLTEALKLPASWSIQRSTSRPHGVTLRSLPPTGTTLVLDPLGQLAIRQQVVPLNTARDIDFFGSAPVAGDKRFRVTASLEGAPMETEPLRDPFAPAQFFEMSDDVKLTAPSYEIMESGCVLGSAKTKIDALEIQPAPLTYVTITIEPEPDSTPPANPPPTAPPYVITAEQLQTFTRSGAAARSPLNSVGRARFRNSAATPAARANPVQWNIRAVSDEATPAAVDPAVRTWSEYQGALKTLNRARAKWQLVPAHELQP